MLLKTDGGQSEYSTLQVYPETRSLSFFFFPPQKFPTADVCAQQAENTSSRCSAAVLPASRRRWILNKCILATEDEPIAHFYVSPHLGESKASWEEGVHGT